ncbi:MAG: nucleotide exchange factor GrpE [Candidatus Omnitrophica bacterium]|nr:nucleotide exchange factor GrpE [Candidatus Omnitrophota bacterium]
MEKEEKKKEEKKEEKKEDIVVLKKEEHQKLLDEVADHKDKYLRIYAEFENMRKRTEREKLEFFKYANQELIIEFLGILDDLERSVEAARANHEDYTAFLKGIEMVMAHVYDLLRKNDVKPIESIGKMFDPNCHEALMQEETSEAEEGIVLDEFQKGYMLGDKVIRTNKVKVAKQKQSESE